MPAEMPAEMADAISGAVEKAIAYLTKTQHSSGYWTDFWLKAGTSDAWVTAYTALMLSEVAAQLPSSSRLAAQFANDCANRAADWLLDGAGPRLSWGYNATTAPDADTTAWAISLLAQLNRPIPSQALDFLQAHRSAEGLFRTYRFHPTEHQWAQPCVDVSLSVAYALLAANAWSLPQTVDYWERSLVPQQKATGEFSGYWWAQSQFPTWLAWRLWKALGEPDMPYSWPCELGDRLAANAAFSQACHYLMAQPPQVELAHLCDQQQTDGSWASAPILRVPPSHQGLMQIRPVVNRDARRIFTTATILAAIAPHAKKPLSLESIKASAHFSVLSRTRSAYGQACDQLVAHIGGLSRFTSQQSAQAVGLFQTLTQASLSQPNAWPAPQLSALSMGSPLEFSVTAKTTSALRYTCEICDPVLSGRAQIDSGLSSLEKSAEQVGCRSLWQNLSPVWQIVRNGAEKLSPDTRFRLWAGIAQTATALPTLKVYANALLANPENTQAGLRSLLSAAGVSYTGELQWLGDKLRTLGFPQEIGFGMRGDGKWGLKIYYEFFGWQPKLIDEIAQALGGFSKAANHLNPSIPGLLSESLLKKRRSGLSFRIHPETGKIVDLTTTAAFPVQLVSAEATHARVLTWLRSQQVDTQAYHQLHTALFSQPLPSSHRSHSLLTRTIDLQGNTKTTLYLRPVLSRAD